MAKFAVAVLVVIAIAGIVLATFQRAPPAEGPVAGDATQAASGPMTATSAPALPGEAEASANQIVFAPDSSQLSTTAAAKLLSIAKKAIDDKQKLSLVGKVDSRSADSDQRRKLVRSRAIAVRGALEANGVPLARMETRIEEPTAGHGTKEANRIEVNPR